MNEKESSKKLEELIQETLDKISTMEDGSKEKATEVENLKKLYEIKMSEIECDNDYDVKMNQIVTDIQKNKKDRWIKIGLGAAEILIPAISFGIFFNKGLKFEETGVVRSGFMRNLIGKMKLGKK